MGSANYIFANTGQFVQLVVQTLDGYDGARVDGYVPIVQSLYYPDLSVGLGYPQSMNRVDVGLYAFGVQLPTGADALGTYIASVYWEEIGNPKWASIAINCARPFGISTVCPM